MEAHRRDMPYCMGSLFWQHNDCWPVASWSSRDYYGRWKAQHYFTKKSYDNILVSPIAKEGKLDIYIVSDFLKPIKGTLNIRVMDLNGTVLFNTKKQVTLPANTSRSYFSEAIRNVIADKKHNEVVINASFTENGNNESITNNYFLTRYKEIDFPKATISKTAVVAGDGFDVTDRKSVV